MKVLITNSKYYGAIKYVLDSKYGDLRQVRGTGFKRDYIYFKKKPKDKLHPDDNFNVFEYRPKTENLTVGNEVWRTLTEYMNADSRESIVLQSIAAWFVERYGYDVKKLGGYKVDATIDEARKRTANHRNLTATALTKTILKLRSKWKPIDVVRSEAVFCTPEQINNGDCDNFAVKVMSEFFPDDFIESLFYREFNGVRLVTADDFDPNLDSHVWIVFDGKHYDSETPEGVDDYRDLPIYRRQFGSGLNESKTHRDYIRSFFDTNEIETIEYDAYNAEFDVDFVYSIEDATIINDSDPRIEVEISVPKIWIRLVRDTIMADYIDAGEDLNSMPEELDKTWGIYNDIIESIADHFTAKLEKYFKTYEIKVVLIDRI